MGLPLLVSVVDDDESVRESLPDLLKEFGFSVQAFSSAEEFLASGYVDATRCLILDVAMPGMSGPDLQRELALLHKHIPNLATVTVASADRNDIAPDSASHDIAHRPADQIFLQRAIAINHHSILRAVYEETALDTKFAGVNN